MQVAVGPARGHAGGVQVPTAAPCAAGPGVLSENVGGGAAGGPRACTESPVTSEQSARSRAVRCREDAVPGVTKDVLFGAGLWFCRNKPLVSFPCLTAPAKVPAAT